MPISAEFLLCADFSSGPVSNNSCLQASVVSRGGIELPGSIVDAEKRFIFLSRLRLSFGYSHNLDCLYNPLELPSSIFPSDDFEPSRLIKTKSLPRTKTWSQSVPALQLLQVSQNSPSDKTFQVPVSRLTKPVVDTVLPRADPSDARKTVALLLPNVPRRVLPSSAVLIYREFSCL